MDAKEMSVGVVKSLWRVRLLAYQEKCVNSRKVVDWKADLSLIFLLFPKIEYRWHRGLDDLFIYEDFVIQRDNIIERSSFG